MKQTAVEYIKKKLQGYGFDFGYVFDEALEMEKEQIKKAWADGNYNTDSNGNPSENYVISDNSYYQKTFKSE